MCNSFSGKYVIVAYLLWLTVGWFGGHHFYLRRDHQGILWLTSFAGYFGIGWLRDFYRIPTYVREANKESVYMQFLDIEMKNGKRPSIWKYLWRIVAQLFFGYFYRGLVWSAIPEEYAGMNVLVFVFIPLGTGFGTYMVSNVGRIKSDLKYGLLGAYVGELSFGVLHLFLDAPNHYLAVSISMLFSTYGWHYAKSEPTDKSSPKTVPRRRRRHRKLKDQLHTQNRSQSTDQPGLRMRVLESATNDRIGDEEISDGQFEHGGDNDSESSDQVPQPKPIPEDYSSPTGSETPQTPCWKAFCKRFMLYLLAFIIFSTLICAFIYFNSSVTTEDGETVKVREAMNNFFKSPYWQRLKDSFWKHMSDLLEEYRKNGWSGFKTRLTILADVQGEERSRLVLGVSKEASLKEIKSRYRELAKELHPDHHQNESPEKIAEMQEKFMEIKDCYEILTKIYKKRQGRS